MPSQQPTSRTPSPWLLLPLAALLTSLPLLLHGPSCGHDQGFHLVSWFDAAAQLRQGHYPRWAIAPAWNAGEPRFLFYPPLSWLLGALLTLTLPPNAAPIAYIFLALVASGLAMYRLAREFAAPHAALLAATFYLANPYMLFNAFERSAFAELLAAAWIPLLMLAVLRTRPTVRGIAIPLALLWLTNAPAAVMGSYLLALLATLRVTSFFLEQRNPRHPERSSARSLRDAKSKDPEAANQLIQPVPLGRSILRLALLYLTGTVLGLALPAFYLLPAAIQRRNIQVEMAVIPNMRFQDNFLFDNTADPGHNGVNHAISLLAVALLTATILAIAILLLQRKRTQSTTNPGEPMSGAPFMRRTWRMSGIATALALLTALITLLLFPISTPLWNHVPELAFLQFPWRLLTILSAVLALTLALILHRITTTPGGPLMRSTWRMGGVATTVLALLIPTTLTFLMYAHTAQGCELRDRPTSIANSLATGHGVSPTDEYTPNNADNDLLRTGNPGYWLAAHPTDPAPNTVPTPTELNPAANTDDFPIPFAQTLSTPAPHDFIIEPTQHGYLILNLRTYPNWDIVGCGDDTMECEHYPQPHRDDGLIALELPPGRRGIHITWHRTWDQHLGLFITCLALLDLILAFFVSHSRSQPS